ncbi:CBS domain-containing protein [Geobacter argillaceus]|uniref:CBS domain protein n=1 Tax=Geobacter argillaceus TaxID=345631 RepID=A0A562VMD0_9BACT|nr:CBS domain-containing protein [Geobacter argillaceus]TWJ18934.1 CBS domain protein [Geobacter argillaceus]
MKSVKDILRNKVSGIFTIVPNATVLTAIELMAEKNIGSLLVMEGDKLVGIITERDYSRKVILAGKSSSNTLVKEIMTQKLVVIQPGSTIEECMVLMIENSVRYLPVIEEGKAIGVISIGNVVNSIISEQNIVINNLQQYIMQG